jgi:MFS family permease
MRRVQPAEAWAGAPPATAQPTAWGVFGIASVAVFLVSLDTTVLFAAFGALRAGFPGSTAGDLSWVLNAYTVVFAALLVPAGRLADAHGRKRIFQLGLVLFLAASAACGAAPDVPALIAARAVQAVGAALLTPSSLALVLDAFPVERRAVAVSIWGAVGGLAAALGPSVGAGVVDALGWRWAFFLNVPFGLLAWWRGQRRVVESRSPDHAAAVDVPGIALVIAAVGALAYGIVRSEAHGWRSQPVLGSMAGGLLALLAFVGWARRTPHPAVDLSLFADRTYRYVNLATLTFGTAFAMMFFGFFFFMRQVWHYQLPRAGLAVTPGPLLVVPVATIATGRCSWSAASSTPPGGCGSTCASARSPTTYGSGYRVCCSPAPRWAWCCPR